jgi:hypothetical protein
MRTNSGVKPKMKGNAVFTVLLFLLCTFSAFSNYHTTPLPLYHTTPLPLYHPTPLPLYHTTPLSHFPTFPFSHFPDTLILDGEIIEIKQKAIKTDTDSLQEARRKDVVRVMKPYLLAIGLNAGVTAGMFNISSADDTLTSVDLFLNTKSKVQFNSHFGIDIRLPIYKGFDVGVGYYFNAISLEGLMIDESTLCPEDERVSFENRGGQLWQNYVVFIDPGYETREDQVTLNSYKLKIKTREIPLSLRYNFSLPESPISLWAGAGVLLRSTSKIEGLPMFTYFINENGEWKRSFFNDPEIVTKSQTYQFDFGVKYQLTPSLSGVVNLGYVTKQNELSNSAAYNWDWSSGFLRIGIAKTFNFFEPKTLFSK